MKDSWTVVAGGRSAWGGCSSHARQMAEAFWKLGHKVLYIECSGDREPFRRVLGQRKQHGHDVVADLERRGFFVMRAIQLAGLSISFPEPIRRWNASRTTARAAKFLAASGAAKVIVFHYGWYFPDLFASARETVRHVYECTDDHRLAPDVVNRPLVRRHVARTEKKLLAKAELTVFSSRVLADARAPAAGAAAVIPMGVDAEHFARPVYGDPHEKFDIQARSSAHPRVGFVGVVSERSDWAMVRAAAAKRPEWQWVIAGPAQGIKTRGPDNLHWLGPTRYEDLPALMQHWDVGFVPYTPSTEFNQRAWPMKLLEYLAAGLPVVSTDIAAARDLAARLPELVFVCEQQTSVGLVEAAERALAVPAWKRVAGRSFTRRCSWEDRAGKLMAALNDAKG